MSAQDYVKGRQDGRQMGPHAVPYAHPANHYQRGFNDGLADVKREAGHPRKTYTVFGVWYKNEAVSVAVVEGRHSDALTGDPDSFAETEDMHESWCLFVEATTAEEAERKAVIDAGGEPGDIDSEYPDDEEDESEEE